MKLQEISITCQYVSDGPDAAQIIESSFDGFLKKHLQTLQNSPAPWYTEKDEWRLISGGKICT